ncbi:MAG: hypothetical protein CBR30_03460 [Dictyoglomus sp. NZ13-RE01]|nr:MAG: hypothetical protein CBR30_03460 [Dictyoglomus sp. NZ13-RE01]
MTNNPVAGEYLVIELYPNDINANTFYYKSDGRIGFNYDYDLEYIIIQKENLKSINGNIYPARIYIGKDRENLLVDKFKNFIYKKDSEELYYSLYVPENYNPKLIYPLVVFLHGAGERGYGNQAPLKANKGGVVWAEDDIQSKFPCFILAPQCPQHSSWTTLFNPEDSFSPSIYLEMVYELIQKISEEYNIDQNRIYLTGLSMGGFGTWALAMAHPDTFSALVPICGGGNPNKVSLIKDIPVWAFHAEDDPIVDKEIVRKTINALKQVSEKVIYTEFDSGLLTPPLVPNPHFSWVFAYNDKNMINWLFSQSRRDKYNAILVEPNIYVINDYRFDSMYLIIGSEKALLIDTGIGEGNLKEFINKLTDKPLEVVVLHGHHDHILQADQFEKVYMSEKEKEILPLFGIKKDIKFLPVKEGDKFDLGDRVLEVIELPGHTPGSIALLDRKNRIIFTSDAIGAGHLWLQVPGASPLKKYLETIKKLEGYKKDFDKIYTGHLYHSGNNPLPPDYIDDVRIAVEKVIKGELKGKPYPIGIFGGLFVEYGKVTLVYNPDLL